MSRNKLPNVRLFAKCGSRFDNHRSQQVGAFDRRKEVLLPIGIQRIAPMHYLSANLSRAECARI